MLVHSIAPWAFAAFVLLQSGGKSAECARRAVALSVVGSLWYVPAF